MYGFNCECFSCACAGLYDPNRENGRGEEAAAVGMNSDNEDEGVGVATAHKQTQPDQFRRVIGERTHPDKVKQDAATRAAR